MGNRRLLFAIFLVVFIDLLGFGLILPLLPYIAESFGASDFQVGLLVSIYAATQLIGAPTLGRLSDRFGRRPLLLTSIAGNMLSFVLLAASQSLTLVFIARALAGLTGGNISVAQAYISDVTDEKNRGKAFGLIGAAFGLGFILGPTIGGLLGRFGFAVPALAAAGVALVNILLVAFWLPESLTADRRREMDGQQRPAFNLQTMLTALRRPYVGNLLHTRFVFGLALSIFQSIFALYALRAFQLQAEQTGLILGYVGLLAVLTQGFLVGRLTSRFGDNQLIFAATIFMAIGLLGWGLSSSVIMLLIDLAPIAIAGGLLNTVINSALSKSVAPGEIGGTLGLAAALESATRVIAPSVGGFLLGSVGLYAPGLVSSLILAWLATYIYRYILHHRPVTLKVGVSDIPQR